MLSFEDWLEREGTGLGTRKSEPLCARITSVFLRSSESFTPTRMDGHIPPLPGEEEQSWSDLTAIIKLDNAIVLISTHGHYVLPHSAFRAGELKSLTDWLDKVTRNW